MPTAQVTSAVSEILVDYLDICQNGITIINADDTILYQNKAQAEMLSLDSQDIMVGRHIDTLFTWLYIRNRGIHGVLDAPNLEAWLHEAHERTRSTATDIFELTLLDGRCLLVTKQSTVQGGVMFISTDISEQKWLQAELVRLHAEVEQLALIDELTGVANRRHLMQQLRHEVARVRRYRQPLCVAMIDLDHFKRINDHYGHPAGDAVLRHFANALTEHMRNTDMIGRVGGEEFAVVMPDTTLSDAVVVLTRMSRFIAAQRLEQVAPGLGYTFSAGVVDAPSNVDCDENGLLSQADQALYQAKTAGRNRIVPFAPSRQ
ncbi:MAG: diguanylate cyclase [Paludibacterium sp.]|uniref:GGDEF domain-containing protein n=1 Tax=Paludibacterium sp. TaxID=1917523 RepID=UPI0025DB503B|nr:sensor domain-containing diguanylate cyclase [Paludibacterium sp.]MBV8049330.1 diguanylate cyclase [Paludibacterium sp.]MBV8646825.1 diguanylate cyclase [Paludibacterium sp.]